MIFIYFSNSNKVSGFLDLYSFDRLFPFDYFLNFPWLFTFENYRNDILGEEGTNSLLLAKENYVFYWSYSKLSMMISKQISFASSFMKESILLAICR